MNDSGDSNYGTHPKYISRDHWAHFDDRPFADEWQNAVYQYAFQEFDRRRYQKVADFGCGSGFKLVKYFAPHTTIGVELEPALSYLKEKYPKRTWRSGENPAASIEGADMLICSDVIEHLPDPDALLKTFAASECELFIISTPALELMADRDISPRLGPPSNLSHIREWTTQEFHNFVSQTLKIIDHQITHVGQCTQMVVAIKK